MQSLCGEDSYGELMSAESIIRESKSQQKILALNHMSVETQLKGKNLTKVKTWSSLISTLTMTMI